jgi:hypothetical protein
LETYKFCNYVENKAGQTGSMICIFDPFGKRSIETLNLLEGNNETIKKNP